MQIRRLSSSDVFDSFKVSWHLGQRHFAVFFMSAFAFGTMNYLMKLNNTWLALIVSFLNAAYAAGCTNVSNITIEKESRPHIKDFFVAFRNATIRGRSIDGGLVSLVYISLVSVIPLLVILGLSRKLSVNTEDHIYIAVMDILPYLSLLMMLPIYIFAYLLFMQKEDWQTTFYLSFNGYLKNWPWGLLAFAIFSLYFWMTTHATSLTFISKLEAKFQFIAQATPFVEVMLAAMIAPFFVATMYLLIKKTYQFDATKDMTEPNIEQSPN